MIIASIDFETANHSDASICAVGIAVFENGELLESRHWLVRPPKGHGWFRDDFTECHGLTWFDVRNAPDFLGIAPEFLERLTHADLVIAHNAGFDVRKLRGTLSHFGVACPDFEFLCTLQMSRRVWPDLPDHRLGTLAAYIGHHFHHHNAQEDAEAAGHILFAMMKHVNAASPKDLVYAL